MSQRGETPRPSKRMSDAEPKSFFKLVKFLQLYSSNEDLGVVEEGRRGRRYIQAGNSGENYKSRNSNPEKSYSSRQLRSAPNSRYLEVVGRKHKYQAYIDLNLKTYTR